MIGYIYQIENLVTNESYIGQTIDFQRRIKTHINRLRRGQHENPKLQNAWNKYGEQEFHFRKWEFEIQKEAELDKLECEYIKKYNSLEKGYNLIPGGGKPPKKQKVKNEDIVKFLCIQQIFGDGYGKTCEEYFGWAKGTASSAKRKVRFLNANLDFESLSQAEIEQIAQKSFQEMNLERLALKRQLTQGGCAKSYQLTQEDYNFAFCAQELGYKASQVAKYFGVKECTVYDWFGKRSRNKERQKYEQISLEEKNRLIGRVKTAELNGNPKSRAST